MLTGQDDTRTTSGRSKGHLQDGEESCNRTLQWVRVRPSGTPPGRSFRETLKDTAISRNDAGSTLVAGLLQVRPKGATKVAPALFYSQKFLYPENFLSTRYNLWFLLQTDNQHINRRAGQSNKEEVVQSMLLFQKSTGDQRTGNRTEAVAEEHDLCC